MEQELVKHELIALKTENEGFRQALAGKEDSKCKMLFSLEWREFVSVR